MSGGTFFVGRSIWDHAAFADEKFTEREAWLWMIGEASWKPRVVRSGDYVVSLDRAQLAHSVRFMAQKWGWTPAKVQRFAKRLQKLGMILQNSDTGVTVTTICNYDEFQGGGKPADTGPIQDRYRTDTNENKDEIQKEEGEEEIGVSDDPPPPSPANDVSFAVSRFNAAAEKAGWSQVAKLNPTRSKQLRARLADCGGIDGWEVALRKAFDSDFCRGRTPKPWHGFSFDWLIKAANFTKLMEGNYDNRDNRPGQSGNGNSMVDAFGALAAQYRNGQRAHPTGN